jgi:ADP-ribosylglycohydrolase
MSASSDKLHAENASKGCGGIMRVAPIGLLVAAGDAESGWPAFELGVETSRLTHGHPAGYLSGGYFAELIAQLMVGKPLREAIDVACTPLRLRADAGEVLQAIDRALRLSELKEAPTPEKLESLGGAWVGQEALAIALYCALAARDFEHGVRLAVNHTGDSDSTGSLVGNVLGAISGVDAIPKRWLDGLELRGVIETIASDLAAVRTGTFDVDKESGRYPGW